jgi:hypothetical protein
MPDRDTSMCYSAFYDEHRLSDIDTPILSISTGSASGKEMESLGAARRVQKTRRRLGRYRHDLLVGLRVVDRVEREVVRSEFEEWVRGERGRCRVVKELGLGADGNSTGFGSEGIAGYEEFCKSCDDDWALIQP